MSILYTAKATEGTFEAKCKSITGLTRVFKVRMHFGFGFKIANKQTPCYKWCRNAPCRAKKNRVVARAAPRRTNTKCNEKEELSHEIAGDRAKAGK